MADGYLSLPMSGKVPNPGTMQFANAQDYIRGVTVLNSSSADCYIYVNRTSAGAPDFIVPSGQNQGVPIASVKYLSYSFAQAASNINAPVSGYAYLHYTTDIIISTSSTININLGAALASMNGFATVNGGVTLQWGSFQVAPGAIGTVAFPVAFKQALYSLTTNISTTPDTSGLAAGSGAYATTNTETVSGFKFAAYGADTSATLTFYWMAVGQ